MLDPTRIDGTATVTSAGPLRCESLSADDLQRLEPAWRRLAAQAIEPNVFYDPAFAVPALPVFGTGVHAVAVWSAAGEMLGLFPLRLQRRRFGLPMPVLVGWTHPYAPLGVPLVAREHAAAAIAAFLDHAIEDRAAPAALLFPFLPQEGPVWAMLAAELRSRGLASATFDGHRRALLAPAERAGYLGRTLGAGRRKELRRQRRRLEDAGPLRFVTARTPAEVAGALGHFLDLEARGWKGRAGTAALAQAATADFITRAMAGLAEHGQARVHRLLLADRPIAAALTLTSGRAAWFWKIAYDEDLASRSPGVQLALDLTAALLAEPDIERVDSCATAAHPMIDRLWAERLALGDLLVALRPGASFAVLRLLEASRRRALHAAKAARARAKGLLGR